MKEVTEAEEMVTTLLVLGMEVDTEITSSGELSTRYCLSEN